MAVINYIAICLLLSCSCEAYKALVVYPMPSKSHILLGNAVVKHLLNDGNEVTYISTGPYKDPPPSLRVVDISSNFNIFPDNLISLETILKNGNPTRDYHMVKYYMTKVVNTTLQYDNVKKLLDDPKEHFDVVIVEWMFSEVLAGLAAVFDCPLIWKSPTGVNSDVVTLIDAAPNPAYSADTLCQSVPPFTFQERLRELWKRVKLFYYNYMYIDKVEANVYETHIGPFIRKRGRVPPSYYDVRYNASLVLANTHVSMGLGMTVPQNCKLVGGYHIEEDMKPLPEDLKKIMDGAKHGVIYFSMGSNLRSKDWPEDMKRGLLKTFGGLKQTVLWKFEEKLADLPNNVHILQWAPQAAILSHPNCVLFISHGGLLSITETIHYGVPIIGIPVYGDQFTNVIRAVLKGFAIKVDLTYNLANDLKPAIEEMTSNPKYKEKTKELSFIYHDRPTKPGAELAHWVKHVVKTRGALHMRSPGLQVPLYQQLYLDLAVIILVLLFINVTVLKFLSAVFWPKSKSKTKTH